jgi:ABC-type dipeptide/oligopeptide/nickel transport system ATPase component
MFKRTLEHLFPNGANWVKTDLHLHSPLVHSFKLPSGINLSLKNDINKLTDDYVEKLIEQKIEICAITDYQQIRKDWFIPFQKAAAGKNIYVFPGVELSISSGVGIHILVIFEYDENIDIVNRYIQSLHKNLAEDLIKQDGSHIDIQLQNNTIVDVIKDIRNNFNAMIIFAHPEEKNGVIKEFQPKEAAELLKYADAIEFINDKSKERLISTGILNKKTVEKLAIIENSDPKSLDEIGTKKRDDKIRCTYLKLSSASVNAFRIAFQDPILRVNKYDKPETIFDRITSISIEGSSFLKDVQLKFNPELNSLIGGRGVGKSALIESIRYCLDLPAYFEESFREEFIQNVVGSGGKISLVFEKTFGSRVQSYKVQRIIGKQPVVEGIDLKPVELFDGKHPILIGQKELYHLSSNKAFQLNLIDELIGDEIKKETQNFKKQILKLDENARQLLNLNSKISQKEQYEQELKTVLEHIKTFDKLGVVKKMELNTALNDDDYRLKEVSSEIFSESKVVENSFRQFIELLENSKTSLLIGKSAEKDILMQASKIVGDLKEEIVKKQEELNGIFTSYFQQLNDVLKNWDNTKVKYDQEISDIKKQLSEQGLSPDKYENFNKQKNRIEPLLKEFSKLEDQIKELLRDREQYKKELQDSRHQMFIVRKRMIAKINKKLAGRVKLEVSYETNKENFKEGFRNVIYGSKIPGSVIDSIIDNESLTIDGLLLSELISSGKDKLQETFGLTEAMTNRLIDWFQDKDKLFELEKLFPEDKITIFLKIDSDYKEFDKLSAGQKATALLILLFTQEDRILIIDQPEEDLDNRFIFDDVVTILRDLKGKRQIILATHNANIPVLGDSEQIFVLEADNEKGCVLSNVGSIDTKSITENIKNIMEGGEEAFRMRIEKYGVKI